MLDEKTREEWNALRASFDERNQRLYTDYVERVEALEDRHRKGERNREDRKRQFLMQLKDEHRESADAYIKGVRNERKALREARANLERERQTVYSKFKTEHGMWGGDASPLDDTQSQVSE